MISPQNGRHWKRKAQGGGGKFKIQRPKSKEISKSNPQIRERARADGAFGGKTVEPGRILLPPNTSGARLCL
jgi:hypothetical protein